MQNSELVIRAYQVADKDILSEIWFRASLDVHSFLGEELLREQKEFLETIYFEKAETWVALINGRIVGFIGLLENFVGGLFVDPQAQGNGIGRQLLNHARMLRNELELEVFNENQGAYLFYKRLGFVEVSRCSQDDNGQSLESILMRLR